MIEEDINIEEVSNIEEDNNNNNNNNNYEPQSKRCECLVMIINIMLWIFFILFSTAIFTFNTGDSLSAMISEFRSTSTDSHAINYTAVKTAYTQYLDLPFIIRNACKQLDQILDKSEDEFYQELSQTSEVVKTWLECLDRVFTGRDKTLIGEVATLPVT